MMRQDKDSPGAVQVPDHALRGTQTQRAVLDFHASGIAIGHVPSLVRALAQVKRAAATATSAHRDLSFHLSGIEIDWDHILMMERPTAPAFEKSTCRLSISLRASSRCPDRQDGPAHSNAIRRPLDRR